MRFSAATLLTLAGSASAAVIPRSLYGSWTVSATQRPNESLYVHAEYTSDTYPEPQRSTCIYNPTTTPVYYRCDRLAFNFEYDGKIIKLTQVVELPNEQTLFGEAPLELTQDLGDGRIRGETIVQVTRAIA